MYGHLFSKVSEVGRATEYNPRNSGLNQLFISRVKERYYSNSRKVEL